MQVQYRQACVNTTDAGGPRNALVHTPTGTHTHTADAWVAVIKPHMFELFHQPLNPHQPESGTERENKDLKRKDEESGPTRRAGALSRLAFVLMGCQQFISTEH